MTSLNFESTKDITIPKSTIEKVIGQEKAVKVIRKAAKQRRHVLLIGEPGTGKSMLGYALTELLPKEQLKDIVCLPNQNDENQPLVRVFPAGKGREFVQRAQMETANVFRGQNVIIFILLIVAMIVPWWALGHYREELGPAGGAIMFAALFLGGMAFLAAFMMFINLGKRMGPAAQKGSAPKLLVDNYNREQAPFQDATGAHAGAMLGDVLHDPFQSGGMGTPAHERVVGGMIQKAHMGVLFIDEIATLHPHTQQELLTALQEGKYPITGQSERSAGAMVRTEPVPCNFILVAAGNIQTVNQMHPALRSRIRGYGYEVFMEDTMKDTDESRDHLATFVAQEVQKDQQIPHFSREAVEELIREAQRMANRKGRLTLRFRELGGLIRAAGDLCLEQEGDLVQKEHIQEARLTARSLEKQLADQYIERKKEYEVFVTSGRRIGRVNGLAVMGSETSHSGILLPIEAQVTGGGKETEIVATGKLGEIAKEAVRNVSAIVKRHFGEDIKDKHDLYIQFLQTYEGVEGDSASIAVAVSIISALKKLPVRQEFAMTGSLSVRGEVLPVGGVTSKIEAAIEAGIKHAIVPKHNMKDIILDKDKLDQIELIPVETLYEVLERVIVWGNKRSVLKRFANQ